jgi:hypothetical protein
MINLKPYIAFLLALIYALGVAVQQLPKLVGSNAVWGNWEVKQSCPNQSASSKDETLSFGTANNSSSTGNTDFKTYIPCLSSQVFPAKQAGLSLSLQVFRFFESALKPYQSPDLKPDPFPPKSV